MAKSRKKHVTWDIWGSASATCARDQMARSILSPTPATVRSFAPRRRPTAELTSSHSQLAAFLAPSPKFFQAESLQSFFEWSARPLVSTGEAIIFVDQIGEPLGNREALVFAVGNRLQKSPADVFPVEIGDPAALRAEEALQNHAPMSGFESFVHAEIPSGYRVE